MPVSHDADCLLWFVLDGSVHLQRAGGDAEPLGRGDTVVVPPDVPVSLHAEGPDLRILEVALHADPPTPA